VRFLLDVNVLVSLVFPDHGTHARAFNWFRKEPDRLWATCPLTQSGFLRVAVHHLGGSRKDLQSAIAALLQFSQDPNHEFWPIAVDLRESLTTRLIGPNQITDLQLLMLAHHHRGQLVTLDKGLHELARGTKYANSLNVL
jgi:hypothetical protein